MSKAVTLPGGATWEGGYRTWGLWVGAEQVGRVSLEPRGLRRPNDRNGYGHYGWSFGPSGHTAYHASGWGHYTLRQAKAEVERRWRTFCLTVKRAGDGHTKD
jgi:hypothetical protein